MSAAAKALPVTTIPEIGAACGGGYYTGMTVEDGKRYLNYTAGREHELKGAWGEYGKDVPAACSYTNSRTNTEAMAAAGSEVAQECLGLVIGGRDDWGIPARDVQELQYRNLKPTTDENYCSFRDGDNPSSVPAGYPYTEQSPAQTSVIAFQEGQPEAFQAAVYWSSTQRSADIAYTMYFDDGDQDGVIKDLVRFVRPARRDLFID
jgi:hypothetical protein